MIKTWQHRLNDADFHATREELMQSEIDELRVELAELKQCLQDSIDCNLNKLLAMTDEQVTALTRLEGSNPEDVAALTRKTMELAVANVKLDALKADAARYQWLLSNAYIGIAPHPKPHEVWCTKLPNPAGCNCLDAAIDAAMKDQS